MNCRSIKDPIRNNDRCNQWLDWKGDFCGNPASNAQLRPKAEILRQRILGQESWNQEDLQTLAKLVHCTRSHSKGGQILDTVNYWKIELRRMQTQSTRSARQVTDIQEPSRGQYAYITSTRSVRSVETRPSPFREQYTTYQRSVDGDRPSTDSQRQPSPPVSSTPEPSTPPARRPVTRSQIADAAEARRANAATPHRQGPVTRSQTAAQASTQRAETAPPRPTFVPRPRSSHDTSFTVAQCLRKRFTKRDFQNGYIYIYTRQSDPGYVKIGHACNVTRRMNDWRRLCGYQPILLYKSPKIQNTHRVEQLIFAQLDTFRHDDFRCRNEDQHPQTHEEWFKVSTADALAVVERWVAWAETTPYDTDGHLHSDWSEYMLDWLLYCRENPVSSCIDLHFGMDLPTDDEGASSSSEDEEEDFSDVSSEEDDETDETEPGSVEEEVPAIHLEECTICLDPIQPDERTVAPCRRCRNSIWHDGCIRHWLDQGSSCPLCRNEWVLPQETFTTARPGISAS